MKTYNKLVRDKIPEICRAHGDVAKTHVITDDREYLAALIAKLREETNEVEAEPIVDELADVLEVILAIGQTQGITPQQIEAARAKKATDRGGFEKRIFLEVTTPASD
jgi:predicted house-cleaning noncanonical NTP pyrophosphatase (MazG superfamily)